MDTSPKVEDFISQIPLYIIRELPTKFLDELQPEIGHSKIPKELIKKLSSVSSELHPQLIVDLLNELFEILYKDLSKDEISFILGSTITKLMRKSNEPPYRNFSEFTARVSFAMRNKTFVCDEPGDYDRIKSFLQSSFIEVFRAVYEDDNGIIHLKQPESKDISQIKNSNETILCFTNEEAHFFE